MVSHYGGEGGEEGCQEHADIPDVDGDVEEVQHVVDGRRCDHQACGTDTTPSAEHGWLARGTRVPSEQGRQKFWRDGAERSCCLVHLDEGQPQTALLSQLAL